jgi:hypothetical protein
VIVGKEPIRVIQEEEAKKSSAHAAVSTREPFPKLKKMNPPGLVVPMPQAFGNRFGSSTAASNTQTPPASQSGSSAAPVPAATTPSAQTAPWKGHVSTSKKPEDISRPASPEPIFTRAQLRKIDESRVRFDASAELSPSHQAKEIGDQKRQWFHDNGAPKLKEGNLVPKNARAAGRFETGCEAGRPMQMGREARQLVRRFLEDQNLHDRKDHMAWLLLGGLSLGLRRLV